ncbi:uncharacterized protein LOC143018705 [Oratosquilla oratoria]|uniref:uncharacterized protein LOC143018705 n=1 Tax=Oratosquilla oratoria TaxID=337810 RepID=UPI003F7709BC
MVQDKKGIQGEARWLPMMTSLALAVFILGTCIGGQHLPNLQPLNGIFFTNIVTVRTPPASFIPGTAGVAFGASGGGAGGISSFDSPTPEITNETLLTALRQGFESESLRRTTAAFLLSHNSSQIAFLYTLS